MNLALEYLIRTGVLLRLFKPPCGLAGSTDTGRLWYSFSQMPDGIQVREWDFSMDKEDLPASANQTITDIHAWTPRQGFVPIPFVDMPSDAEMNAYNRPMKKEEYEFFVMNQFRNNDHEQYKADWLWDSFASYFHLDSRYREIVHVFSEGDPSLHTLCLEEQIVIRYLMPEAWQHWDRWRHTFVSGSGLSCELLFANLEGIAASRL